MSEVTSTMPSAYARPLEQATIINTARPSIIFENSFIFPVRSFCCAAEFLGGPKAAILQLFNQKKPKSIVLPEANLQGFPEKIYPTRRGC
jgi:hypothetical protein